MADMNIIDVTLRDGGYKTNFHFNDQELENILIALDKSGIEYIEVGYRNGSLKSISNIGSAGLCSKNYLMRCRSLISKAKLVVMLHPKNIQNEDLKELRSLGVDAIRICVLKNSYKDSSPIIAKAKELGLSVSINITRVTQYAENELDELVSFFSLQNIDMIYFADSNGSMLPSEVKFIYEKYLPLSQIPFGFHAHDNLGLAQANAIAAFNSGARFIDVSLSGVGKGVGNLKAEFFTAYLHAAGIKKYNIYEILNASNFVRNTFSHSNTNIAIKELIMGISNLSIDEIGKIDITEYICA